jgi:hypothetical protein
LEFAADAVGADVPCPICGQRTHLYRPPENAVPPAVRLSGPIPQCGESEYYLELDDKKQGPFTIRQLRSLWNAAKITAKTHYTQPGMDGWRPLSDILSRLEPDDEAAGGGGSVKTAKSRGVYIILGIFFGTLGIHNFYAGYHEKGSLQITVLFVATALIRLDRDHSFDSFWRSYYTLLGFLGALLVVALFLWVIRELVTTKTDAKGEQLV